MKHLFALLMHAGQYKKDYILGPVFKVIEAIFELIIPIVVSDMIDRGVNTGDTAYIRRCGITLVILTFVGFSSTMVCQFLASRAAQGTGTVLRSELFSHIMTLSHSQLDGYGTPTLISRVSGDVNQVQTAAAMLIRLAVRAPFLAAGAIVMSAVIDLRLSLILLIAAPLIYLSIIGVTKASRPLYKEIQRQTDSITRITRENLTGSRVIRAFSRQGSERGRFETAAEASAEASVKVGVIAALLNPLTTVIMNLGVIAILGFGGLRVDSGALTQGQLVALINYINQILLALIVLANIINIFTRAEASATRIQEILNTKSAIADPDDPQPFDPSAPAVELKNVTFSYGAGDPALEDVSVSVMPGHTLGIIGGTGSGKSSIVNLIMRFWDLEPGMGEVRVMGADVRNMKISDLRSRIGLVPQKAELVSGTIRSNLLWGDSDASDDELTQTLKTAQAWDFTEAKEGLDTKVEMRGRNFSGGQRQRLTIARAIAGKPDIVILDDSSSALDAATDARL
nr:ABC transporter ATP-binding protein/permease [Clostridiales bacterium]